MSAGFRPILVPADLPVLGEIESHVFDCKATLPDPVQPFRLARQVAAFANSVGGTILIGAVEQNEALTAYRPCDEERARHVLTAYHDATRTLCSPIPLVMPARVESGDGYLVAVNVWVFPGQAVGVRTLSDRKEDGREVPAYCFPPRIGATTTEILPEQLPMLMLPDLRRIAVLLSAIPEGSTVTIISTFMPRDTTVSASILRVDYLENVAVFARGARHSQESISVPLDRIETVWKAAEGWRLMVRGRVMSGDRGVDFYLE